MDFSRRSILLTTLCGFIPLAFVTDVTAQISKVAAEFNHTSWDGLLKKYVLPVSSGQTGLATQVDYQGFAKDRANLQRYLSALSKVQRTEFDGWSNAEQLAFLINAYNAWTIELILTAEGKINSIKDLGSLFKSPWKKKFISLFGEVYSLDELEHGLIRGSGRYNDPRIHFAVNCASIGCPALRVEAYVAEKLEFQLEDATFAFLSDPVRNRLEPEALKISSIFKWYKEDFEKSWRGTKNLQQFLAKYGKAFGLNKNSSIALASGHLTIEFLDYDWRLNSKAVKP